MTRHFNKKIIELPYPATIAMSRQARALKAQGRNVVSLALGEPDFLTPPDVIEAAHQAALNGQTKYPPVDGTKALKEAISRKFERENDLHYELNEIIVSNGGKQSIFNALMATLNVGDEVVIPIPYWVSYPLISRMFGGKPIFIPCSPQNNFHLQPHDLRSALSSKTRWVILNYPSNPTGATYTAEELHAIAHILRQYPQTWILCDEMYEHLTFDDRQHVSLAAIAPDLKDRILTLNGVSKAYAMTGWRVGFAGGPKDLIAMMRKIQGNCTSGICTVAQAAATQALNGSKDIVTKMVAAYNTRRHYMVNFLNKLESIDCTSPEGTFYVYPSIKNCLGKKTRGGQMIKTDTDFAQALLLEENVATVPGTAFGYSSPFLRLSCATSDNLLEIACTRLKHFVSGLT